MYENAVKIELRSLEILYDNTVKFNAVLAPVIQQDPIKKQNKFVC